MKAPALRSGRITMRTLMGEMRIPNVDLLKVDIEGAEKEVFEACTWIKDIRALMIEYMIASGRAVAKRSTLSCKGSPNYSGAR